jgi:hypothetical protein
VDVVRVAPSGGLDLELGCPVGPGRGDELPGLVTGDAGDPADAVEAGKAAGQVKVAGERAEAGPGHLGRGEEQRARGVQEVLVVPERVVDRDGP